MEIEFDDPDLDRLARDSSFTAGHPPVIVKGFRKVVQFVRAAPDERALIAMHGLNFHRLKHDRAGQHSLNINDQYRLIIELRGEAPKKRIGVIEIVDYH